MSRCRDERFFTFADFKCIVECFSIPTTIFSFSKMAYRMVLEKGTCFVGDKAQPSCLFPFQCKSLTYLITVLTFENNMHIFFCSILICFYAS